MNALAPGVPSSLDRVETVLVPRGGSRLHLPGPDGPACATHGEFRRKPLAVFPESHRDWCGFCRGLVAERADEESGSEATASFRGTQTGHRSRTRSRARSAPATPRRRR
jgi:hypothetical protein